MPLFFLSFSDRDGVGGIGQKHLQHCSTSREAPPNTHTYTHWWGWTQVLTHADVCALLGEPLPGPTDLLLFISEYMVVLRIGTTGTQACALTLNYLLSYSDGFPYFKKEKAFYIRLLSRVCKTQFTSGDTGRDDPETMCHMAAARTCGEDAVTSGNRLEWISEGRAQRKLTLRKTALGVGWGW